MSSQPQPDFTLTGADLAEFDNEFDSAKPTTGGDSVPDGNYQVRVQAARLAKSREKKTPMIKWELLVISGSHAGRRIFTVSLFSPNSMPYTKGALKLCGVEPDRLSDLPRHLPALLDKTLEVTVKAKGEYVNVYFNKAIDLPAGAFAPPGTIPSGDIPF